jgi:hypothetical protein
MEPASAASRPSREFHAERHTLDMLLFNFTRHTRTSAHTRAAGSIFTDETTRPTRGNWIIHQAPTFYYHARMLSKQAVAVDAAAVLAATP